MPAALRQLILAAGLILSLSLVWPEPLAAAFISEDCAHLLQELEDELYAGAKCDHNDQCIETYIGCPFGCGTAVNQTFDTATFAIKKKLYENQLRLLRISLQRGAEGADVRHRPLPPDLPFGDRAVAHGRAPEAGEGAARAAGA
jgi:hypothetical protein